jgi:subtilisin family serine protease
MFSGTDRPRVRHGRRAATLVTLLVAVLGSAQAPNASADLTPALEARLADAAPDAQVGVIVTLRRQVDAADYAGHPAALLRALRATAASTQDQVADDVSGPVRRFWLVNALAARATPAEVRALAEDPAVERVDLDAPVRVSDDPATDATPFPDAGAGDWGLDAIGARSVWSAYGLTGAGVRVGSIDTGVNAAHPDLAGKVVGWRDFVNGRAAPYDDNGHGTHTVGTMVGGSAGGSPIGVAPGARVVVAKAMNANGVGAGSNLLAAAQWMTDPDGNPATADYPSVVNNSWSTGDANDPWFHAMVRQWVALGIVPVFAAGNSGPGAGTVGSPASYPESVAVGAVDQASAVASFSARGPVVWRDLDGGGPAAGTLLTKPDVVAPGVAITSSVGTGYLAYSGTSMASPHVAGLVALMRQAAPDLAVASVEDIIRSSARDLGAPGADGTSGAGLVSAPAAVAAALGPGADTALVPVGAPVSDAGATSFSVTVSGGTRYRVRVDGGAWSDASSSPTLTLSLAEGRHAVEAQGLSDTGVPDPTPARAQVTVDRTPPSVRVVSRPAAAGRIALHAQASDALSGVDPGSYVWTLPDGSTVGGAALNRAASAGTARLSVRDLAGNAAAASGSLGGAQARPIRTVSAKRRVSRRAGRLVVRGRVSGAARVRAALRPGGAIQMAQARRQVVAAGRPRRGTFSVSVPLRGVRPGAYRLVVVAVDAAGRAYGRPAERTVRVTP